MICVGNSQDIDELLADAADEAQDADVEFNNVINRFTLLGNSQFMENVSSFYSFLDCLMDFDV